jgi:hypothetical protein
MSRVCRWLAILSAIFSVTAFFLALWGGSLVMALHGLLAALGLLSGADERLPYPLGVWVFPLYLAGLAVSLAALRHPRWAGLAMIPLGLCAALLGGPLAQLYGWYMTLAGGAIAALSVFDRASPYPDAPQRAASRSHHATD